MAFNPSLPQANALISSSELRDQFNGLKELVDEKPDLAQVQNQIQTLAPRRLCAHHVMKTYLILLISLGLVFLSYSRLIPSYSFDALIDKATVVVIATPTTVTATTNQTSFFGGPIKGTGVETVFRILGVFKGDRTIKELTLRHFARATPESEMKNGVRIMYGYGPRLISFEPNSQKQYLMFLHKETDGRYEAVTGQEDPIDSVKQLKEEMVLSYYTAPQPTPTGH